MNDHEYNLYIENYLKNDKTKSAIMLIAPWGMGKSYYIQNSLIPHLEQGGDKKCVVVSLYGLNGSEINLEMAYINFVKARELGVKKASFYLGLLYDWYCYPNEDFQLAKVYYEENIDNPSAQVALGFQYMNGQGVEVNKKKAKTIFQSVVNAGYADGYFGLGDIEYFENENYAKAFDYYNRALEGTEQCYKMWIMDKLGDMYRYGTGYTFFFIRTGSLCGDCGFGNQF